MHLVLLAAALGVTGPPAIEPGPDGGDAIGIAWHDQATVAPEIQQRLARAVGDGPVVLDAPALARARVALELGRERMDQAPRWAAQLEDAAAAYRGGEIERAHLEVIALLDAIRSDPVVPGAARLAWRAQVLRGQLAWAEGDAEQTREALAAAIAIDPEARPSTREVPPPVVEAYSQQRAAVVAETSQWPTLEIHAPDGEPFAIEIDGVPGRRAVPPGEHLVVVRRPGVAPLGTVMRADEPWVLPPAEPVLPPGLPPDEATAQRICDSADLGWLVLARERDGRLGLQRFTCGGGFSEPWIEAREGWGPGVAWLRSVAREGESAEPMLHLDDPWPPLPALPRPAPRIAADGGHAGSHGRARLRRALPWLLISGVIAGSVTVGVLLGTEPGADLAIDGNGFLGR
ncbi:MAG: hypothetical protein H6712_02230 [Myxococcales bacterium]|nr:hypothetical protein [Myxococcales bacterium]MCB9712645.1 hypothetical protein [Myxococcales bacterium]